MRSPASNLSKQQFVNVMPFALITSTEHRRKHQERPENYEKFAPWRLDKIPANVWLGVTCEDQQHYERRWGILSRPRISATFKFVSYEPALGPLMLHRQRGERVPDWIRSIWGLHSS
jgi:protein gp37